MRLALIALIAVFPACQRPADDPQPVEAATEPEAAAVAEPAPPLFDGEALGIATGADLVVAGRGVAAAKCSACHGLDAEPSLVDAASPLRFLLSFYPEETRAAGLRAGITSGHGAGGAITLSPEEMDALLAYMVSIQQAPL